MKIQALPEECTLKKGSPTSDTNILTVALECSSKVSYGIFGVICDHCIKRVQLEIEYIDNAEIENDVYEIGIFRFRMERCVSHVDLILDAFQLERHHFIRLGQGSFLFEGANEHGVHQKFVLNGPRIYITANESVFRISLP